MTGNLNIVFRIETTDVLPSLLTKLQDTHVLPKVSKYSLMGGEHTQDDYIFILNIPMEYLY
jgi:hypothetical protein